MVNLSEKLLGELEEAEFYLNLIQEYKKGAHYDSDRVRESVVSLKEKLSQIRMSSAAWSKNVFGKEIEFPFGDLPKVLDEALALMEIRPQLVRAALQLALMHGQTKIEDTVADISAMKVLVKQVQSSLGR